MTLFQGQEVKDARAKGDDIDKVKQVIVQFLEER
jgi:hypothetical protein